MQPTNIKYRAVHEITPWRKAGHESLENALYGEKDGAPGLFAYRARIDYDLHGEPLFVAVWEEGGKTGYLVKRDSSSSEGTMRVSVDVTLLEGFEADGGATIAQLEALFSSAMIDPTSPRVIVEEHPTIDEADEGALLLKKHLLRERNFALVKSKKASVLASTGCLACEVCNFDFTLMYGEIGAGYCEVHHTEPLGQRLGTEKTSLNDLAVLCSNCHSIIHRTKPMLSVSALAAHLKATQEKLP